jgi:hypothetical protein
MNAYIEDRDPGDEDPKQFMLMELQRCANDHEYFMERYGYVKTDFGFKKVRFKPRQLGFERTQQTMFEREVFELMFPLKVIQAYPREE